MGPKALYECQDSANSDAFTLVIFHAPSCWEIVHKFLTFHIQPPISDCVQQLFTHADRWSLAEMI